MSWIIVYIEESDYLSLYLDNIKIKRNSGEDIIIPLSDIHSLIIDNYKSTLSVNLINKCVDAKVNVLLCGIDHMPKTLIYPISGNNQSPLMLRKQIGWSKELKDILQKKIVKGKIENQIQILVEHDKSEYVINKLQKFKDEVKIGDTSNREGLSAKMYFRELFGEGFRRFNNDIINIGLNYGYSILRSQISKVLLARGLNPSIGIFHIGPENTFNLSDDVIEVFRPLIDNYVYKTLREEEIFTREHRLELIKLTTNKMKYKGQKQTFLNVINLYVIEILNFLEFGVDEVVMPKIIDYYDL